MTKVLHVLNGLGSGGAEAFAINTVKTFKSDENYQFDFLIRTNNNNIYRKTVENLGSRVFIAPQFPRNLFLNYKYTKDFFVRNKNEYDYIHIHANALIYTLPIFFSQRYTNAKVILHSHNTTTSNPLFILLHRINKLFIKEKIISKIACSQKAGEWLFKTDFQVIPNSIDSEKYRYSSKDRELLRNKYKLKQDDMVIGSVGRLHFQKNQMRLIEIFMEYQKIQKNVKLILVGDGPLKEEILKYIENNNLENDVILTGSVTNVDEYYSLFDLFLMPSLYEGLPISLIEAQASGLPCVVSNEAVPNETDITGLLYFESLTSSNEKWVEKIRNVSVINKRQPYAEIVSNNGFGESKLLENMKRIYR